MYNLYFDKKEVELKIKKVTGMGSRLQEEYPVEPKQYNDCYWICLERKPLKELAQQIKSEWLHETETLLEKIKTLNV